MLHHFIEVLLEVPPRAKSYKSIFAFLRYTYKYRKKASFGHLSSLLVTMIYLYLSKCFQTKMILAYSWAIKG